MIPNLPTSRKHKSKMLATIIVFGLFTAMLSCKKESATIAPTATVAKTDTIFPSTFNFNTVRLVSVNINLASNSNEPIAGVPVDIYDGDPATTSPILTTMSDVNGLLNAQVNVPASVDTLIVDAKYIGLLRNAKAVITNNTISGTIGGLAGYSGSIIQSNVVNVTKSGMFSLNTFSPLSAVADFTAYSYMGAYDNSGVPKYLVSPPDKIPASLLAELNMALPETVNVATRHPEYLSSTTPGDIAITQQADVWITFVSEGAGYLNGLGYYTYPTGNPPQSAADIKTVNYIFPNASLPGSGGGLNSGSKVHLGVFAPGTSIGYVLLSNGWNSGTQLDDPTVMKFYSTTACNPEPDASLKKHTVMLYSASQNLYLEGFEDMYRENPSCDNDFNDVVFYTSSNPITAISNTNVNPLPTMVDSDGDGVPDYLDAFPNDPTRAYISYYPSATTFGTTAFEDLWPGTGDYDMNDDVVRYRYKTVLNAQNLAVEIYGDYYVQAAGASYVSGFGVQFPFSPSQVASVTGQKFANSYVKENGNGTEAGQSKAVIVPFDSYLALIKRPDPYYINTQLGARYMTGDTAHVHISFTKPLSASALGNAPFNPFLISNMRRGYEIHLPNAAPTDLADKKVFGTGQDATNLLTGRTYVSKKQWPWALDFAGPFNYPTEGTNITQAYYKFTQWAQSGGTQYTDWYNNSYSWYINAPLLYTH